MFEVGKKYRVKGQIHDFDWPCIMVKQDYAILEDNTGMGLVVPIGPAYACNWEPSPPPLTFRDLKVGEKFRLVITDPSQCVYMKIQQAGGGPVYRLRLDDYGGMKGLFFIQRDEDIVERVP